MTKFRTLGIYISVLALLTLNSCDKNEEGQTISPSLFGTETVDELIVKNSSLSSLETALGMAAGDLPGTLNGSEVITIFAPNDNAFEALAEQKGFGSTADLLASIGPELLAKILSYHVIAGKSDIASLTDGTTLTAVAGGDLLVTSSVDGDNRTVQILDATKLEQTNPVSSITGTVNYASNGVIHIVDKVLLSEEVIEALDIDTRPSILNWATSTAELSTLVKTLEKAGLVDTIKDLDSATVLAPTNEAFTEFLNFLGDDYDSLDDFDNEAEIAFLGDVLKYHVLSSGVSSEDLMAGQVETASEDNSVEIIQVNGGFTIGDATNTNANITTVDLIAKNGFVHVIDKVLLSQTALDFKDLLDSDALATVVGATPQLSVLEEALIATDLVSVFNDNTNESFVKGKDEKDEDFETRRTPSNYTYFKPATVFAPSNAAFTELLGLLGDDFTSIASFDTEEELALLKEILLYHVVPGKITSADLKAGILTTASEGDIEVIQELGTDTIFIGNAKNNVRASIEIPDVAARNGVAHIIDKVLLPGNALIFIKSLSK